MTKKIALSVIYIVLTAAAIHGDPRRTYRPGMPIYDHFLNTTQYDYMPRKAEKDIPMPEFQYELPQTLVGQFVMVSSDVDHIITIYPSNKYIILYHLASHLPHEIYGHIVNIDNTWYFSPIKEQRYSLFEGDDMIKINLTDSGFSYHPNGFGLYKSMRKENMPKPDFLADDISVSRRTAKKQYYLSETGMVDYDEINNITHGFDTHRLEIKNGVVDIALLFHYFDNPEFGEVFLVFGGFMEKTSETLDSIKGIIRFTNGIPYYYISGGTAEIELFSDGRIKITMLYTPYKIPKEYENLHFPLPLVLEF